MRILDWPGGRIQPGQGLTVPGLDLAAEGPHPPIIGAKEALYDVLPQVGVPSRFYTF